MTPAHRQHPYRTFAAAFVLALAAAACGGGGETADAPDGGEPTGAAGEATGTDTSVATAGDGQAAAGDCGPLTVGALNPLTGELGSFGQDWQNGIELAVDHMNEAGALPGGEATYVSADEQADPEVGLREAQSMMADDVSVIVGPTSSSIVAMVDAAAENETPILSPAAGTVSLEDLGGEWVYTTVAYDTEQGVAVTLWFEDAGVEEIAMLVQNEEATTSPAAVLEQRFTDGGGTVLANVVYNPGQPSYQAQLQTVLDTDPPMIFLAGGQESGATIMREAFQSGYEGNFLLTSETTVQEMIDAVGAEQMEGVQGMTPQADTSLPTYQDFEAAFEEAYGAPPELFTANAYDATIVAGLAAVASGSACGADINAALREVAGPPGQEVTSFEEGATALADGEDIDYTGASGPLDFDENGSVASSYSILEVQGGEWQEIEFYPATVIQEALEAGS